MVYNLKLKQTQIKMLQLRLASSSQTSQILDALALESARSFDSTPSVSESLHELTNKIEHLDNKIEHLDGIEERLNNFVAENVDTKLMQTLELTHKVNSLEYDVSNISQKIDILTQSNSELNEFLEKASFLPHLKNPNILFENTEVGITLKTQVNKLIEYIQKNDCKDELPLITTKKDDYLDRDTVVSFNTEASIPFINKYFTAIKDLASTSSLTDSTLKEVSRELVTKLLQHAFNTNLDFKSFIETNMNCSNLSIKSFPHLFTYAIQAYGHLPFSTLCTTIISDITLLNNIPSIIENFTAHENYISQMDESRQTTADNIDANKDKFNDEKDQTNKNKLSALSSTQIVAKFLMKNSNVFVGGFVLLGGNFLINNPELIAQLKNLDYESIKNFNGAFWLKKLKDLASEQKPPLLTIEPPVVDSIVPRQEKISHPIFIIDKLYIAFREQLIKVFGNPDN